MKVIKISDLADTEREVQCPRGGFTSFRALLKSDGMGFSMHKTVVPPGPPQFWHYKHHKEACYCIAGRGVLTNYRTGEAFTIEPDTIYVLDQHDPHTLQAIETVVLVSVFNPPVTGTEVHGADGSYDLEDSGDE
jgi:L-ectoine synthase